MDTCVICSEKGDNLALCKDSESWARLCRAAVIRQHRPIQDLSTGDLDFSRLQVKYHASCRKAFVNEKKLQSLRKETAQTSEPQLRRSARDMSQGSSGSSSVILPDLCIFCKREKYKPGTKTREKLSSVQEFRADNTIKESALLHLKRDTNMKSVAAEISGVCAKDLICSEARYHSSCYRSFSRILYEPETTTESSTETQDMTEKLYESVFSFCNDLALNPRVIEFKDIRKILADEAKNLGVAVTQSQYKNLLRVVSNKFEELTFINYQQNKVLVFPNTLKIENLVIDNFELKCDLDDKQTSFDESTKTVISAAKQLHDEIKKHPAEMPWPPTEKDLNSR